MAQPRDRQQDQSPNKQGKNPPRESQAASDSDKRSNPDRYPDQGKQAQKPSGIEYPEQDPTGKAERPDAVDGVDSGLIVGGSVMT